MDDDTDEPHADTHLTPEARAAEKAGELRMHSELAAIFEGPRKFEARIFPGLAPEVARDVQKAMAKLERAKIENTPVIEADAMPEAARVLSLPATNESLTTNDYHIYRRPGEVMMIRWLADEEVETFYSRYQAHCDAALGGAREEERSSLSWRADEATTKYLDALDAFELDAAALYTRPQIQKHGIFILSTTVTDEMSIRFIADHLMGADVAEITGPASAPEEDAPDSALAWFFKLFALRGKVDEVERMCFFAFLQKSDDDEFEF